MNEKEIRKFYNSVLWKRISALFRRHYPTCQHCNKEASQDVDHIVALADNGNPIHHSNLQALCRACHNAKTGREAKKRKFKYREFQ